ncbi:hypothetical protein C4579_00540 [Candidatus Microgenomates bacterium]|nr:MAG: hypothetical protein C4579_00540 [Candidatus Microgenomates bacterium]
MQTALERKPGNTIELTITLPWKTIEASYQKIFELLLAEVALPGFRKGKAPRDLASKQIDKSKVYEEVIKEVLPKAYAEALQEHKLAPIMHPAIEVVSADEGKDWKVKATTCEKPTVTLKDYQKAITTLKKDKKGKIWTPGKNEAADKKEEGPTVGEVLDAIYSAIEVEISTFLVDHEVNRMLSNLLSETQKLGLTVEQYLQSQGKTAESLRQEYADEVKKNLSLEFALEEIADKENVTVADSEIDSMIKNAKTDEERKAIESRRYYVTSVLRRQKTISKLLETPTLSV